MAKISMDELMAHPTTGFVTVLVGECPDWYAPYCDEIIGKEMIKKYGHLGEVYVEYMYDGESVVGVHTDDEEEFSEEDDDHAKGDEVIDWGLIRSRVLDEIDQEVLDNYGGSPVALFWTGEVRLRWVYKGKEREVVYKPEFSDEQAAEFYSKYKDLFDTAQTLDSFVREFNSEDGWVNLDAPTSHERIYDMVHHTHHLKRIMK